MSVVRVTLSSANVLKRCRCTTAGEIGRLRALQNDLHYNRLCIRERRSMRSKRHYLCMRRNYNNCTIMCVCARAADRCCKTRADVQDALARIYTHIYTHTYVDAFPEIVYRFVGFPISKQSHPSTKNKSRYDLIAVSSSWSFLHALFARM